MCAQPETSSRPRVSHRPAPLLCSERAVSAKTERHSSRAEAMLGQVARPCPEGLGGRAHSPPPCALGGEVDATTSIQILG